MAMDILSIPAMSDEPERVFSGARCMVSWERSQIEPKTLEIVECLKH
jgi:hAT family C-terminal dimerisation region